MTKSTIKIATSVAIALGAAACDWSAAKELKEDRNERLYKTAMADYSAGRIDIAVSGFEKTLRANPSNASARFQLASLLQDHKRDYLSALCQYREYLLQCPSSDKSDLARERAEICERQYVAYILNQMKDGEGPVAKEMARLKAEADKANAEIARLAGELAKVSEERDAAKRDSEFARKLVRSVGEGESVEKPDIFKSATDLLDDDGASDRIKYSADIRNLIAEEDDEGMDRDKLASDIKALLDEEESETTATPFDVAEKKTEPDGDAKPSEKQTTDFGRNAPKLEPRPDTYVVQEGDTLYKIALRFYGKRSAWTRIRDANKAEISTDGRVKAGAKITLPE